MIHEPKMGTEGAHGGDCEERCTFFFFLRTFFRQLEVPLVRAALSLAHAHHARKGNLEGCPASASSRTHPSGVCSSPVGCNGARQQPPNSVEAKARCNAHPSCPHHRRARPARAAARSARRAQGALLREAADEIVRLLPPSPADLRSQDDEALRARAGQFRLAPLFAPPRDVDGSRWERP